jgi:CubicO group peptidase (beta-lactamase class C family)
MKSSLPQPLRRPILKAPATAAPSLHPHLTGLILLLAATATPLAAPAKALGQEASQEPAPSRDVVLTAGTPEEVGMSSAILEAGVQLYRDAVEAGDLVGAVLLVAKDGKVVLHEAVGWRHKGRGLPMERNTMFRMASNTKAPVATAVSVLVEEGKLRFEAPVREYIPSFDNYRSGFIQVRHLLNHTSGLRIGTLFLSPYMEPSPEHPGAPNLRLEAARFGLVGAEFLPGTTYSYSNPGYNTLGALVEIASGQALEAFLRDRVYAPLGMQDSYHHEVADKLDGKLDRMGAVYYNRDEAGEWIPGWEPGNPPQVPFVRASGGMISTAMDYAVFCQTFLNGGVYAGTRILQERTVRVMTSDTYFAGSPPDPETGFRGGYGYGWNVARDGTFSHTGSDGTGAWVDPSHDLIVLVFTQTPRGNNPRGKFLELVRSAIMN